MTWEAEGIRQRGCLVVTRSVNEILSEFIIPFHIHVYQPENVFAILVNIWKHKHIVNYWSKACEF